MDILKTREQLRSCSIYDLPLRVTFYARVSTEKDAQLNSLDNQISFYSNMIKKNPNWEYVEGYIDEGLSAISTEKRENFHRMVTDGENGEFDMIILKFPDLQETRLTVSGSQESFCTSALRCFFRTTTSTRLTRTANCG